ncbi:porin family protein [Proteiniphilum sp. UBA1028]|jgi:hypothetical protein|uniref:type IX secretion/gliding motility protein PorT/SprT n=1 Tax=Proteiniphilum sp. UBA1028 TaxID=1947251 RepID=UPI000E8D7310|nr:porin family protein [Proteiniphilum sp. UBA1028]HBG57070.1 PorT protein [Porphyromonadaceae bacterium]
MKKTTIFFCLLLPLFSGHITGQHQKLQHRPYVDQRLFHLGFTVGLHTQDLILTQSGYVNENGEVWFSEIPNYTPGFSAGMIADMHLNRYLNLRAIPTLSLGEKHFVFREQLSGEEFSTHIRNNYLSLPIHLKISTGRIDNFRPYFLLGGYGSIELGSQKKQAVLLKPYDFGIELGVGCDFYLPLFKLAPELKFEFGMIDILNTDRTDLTDESLQKYARSLSKATQRMITLSVHFE